MDRFLLVCLAFAVASAVPVSKSGYQRTVSYEGEILVRCPIKVPSVKSFLDNDHIDIWKISPEGEADIRVAQSVLESSGVGSECIKLGDIETIVQKAENLTFTGVKADWFEEYHRYADIVEWYQNLARSNSDIVKYVDSIGKSVEGRDQPAIHITASTSTDRNIIYFQCQIHAREWISGATCMYIANYLVENSERDNKVKNLLEEVEFVIVPFVNPDGYEYTWSGDRLWRKNRQPGTPCYGVDLNRNYNDKWGEQGSSNNPCSEIYHGVSVESEPETKNTAGYFKSFDKIIGAIDWHSYGQLILRPYGDTSNDSPDEAQLKQLGDDMSNDIFAVDGNRYMSQKGIGLYPTTGTASDWFYTDDANVNNDYRAAGITIELRDTGRYGFQLPPDQIIRQGEEIIPAVLRFAEELNRNPLRQ